MIENISPSERIGRDFSPNPGRKTNRDRSGIESRGLAFADIVKIGIDKDDRSQTETNESEKKENSVNINELHIAFEKQKAALFNYAATLFCGQAKNSSESSLYKTKNTNAAQAAYSAVSENGEYGVKAVSDRIVSFAIAISGGDKTKLTELKAAIIEGFEKAGQALGGNLPQICKYTYDEVMKKLDIWYNSVV